MKIALFSAFPQELKHLRAHVSPLTESLHRPFRIVLTQYRNCRIIAAETGMRTTNIVSAFKHVTAAYRPDLVVCLGFGGALYCRADIGDLVIGSRYFFSTPEGIVELPQLAPGNASLVDRRILPGLERKIGVRRGSLVSAPRWTAKSKLKEWMPADAPFPLCDRETVLLARLSLQHDVPFCGIRSVADTLDECVPQDLFQATDSDGMFRLSRALGSLLMKPSLLPFLLKLRTNAARASGQLGEAVKALIEVLTDPVTGKEEFEKSDLTKRAQRTLRSSE